MSHTASDPQDLAHAHSLQDPASFWDSHAKNLHWETPYTTPITCSADKSQWTWFPGGKISTTYNLITRHVLSGNGDATAIIWDSPVTGSKRRISYRELQEEVEVFAAVMRERGVGRGDRVLIYSMILNRDKLTSQYYSVPMIPEATIAMLATVHLGAIHCVVFGGFAPGECSKRIESAEPKLILTASCGIEGGSGGKRRVIPYLPLVREAIEKSSWKPQNTVLFQREELFQKLEKGKSELNWNRLVRSERVRRGMAGVPSATAITPTSKTDSIIGVGGDTLKREKIPGGGYVEIGEAFPSEDPQYIIYTSGTTGKPKGVVRSTGGHLVGLQYTIAHLFNITSRNDTIFCASDLGWVVGHAYILYSPLLVGASTILFEGKPIGTPDASTFWRIVEEHKVNVLSTAPTALRAIHREDPHLEGIEKHDLSSLRALFLAGERSEASIVELFQKRLWGGYDGPGIIVDNWWSSESGSPMSGVGLGFNRNSTKHPMIKPGSAGKPMPGWNIHIVDDSGAVIKEPSQMGNIVLGLPLAPTGFRSLWNDNDGAIHRKAYRERFPGLPIIDTGDAGFIDADGFLHIMSRTDDVINVAAHRFSTGTMEQSMLEHPSVAEAYIVPCPDSIKGHVPFGFVVLDSDFPCAEGVLTREINDIVRREIGPIAVLMGAVVVSKVPRTRSGKTMRRVMREIVENAVAGRGDKKVEVPPTIEDVGSVESVRLCVEKWFKHKGVRPKL